jgi:hypothetical protein
MFWLRDCKVMYFEVGGRALGYPGEREWGVDVEQQSNSYGERNAWAIYDEMEKELWEAGMKMGIVQCLDRREKHSVLIIAFLKPLTSPPLD